MSGFETIAKAIVVIINVILMIFGLACLIVGIVFKLGWDKVRDAFVDKAEDVNFDVQSAGDLLAHTAIVIGAFIVVVTLLGIIGACCRVTCLLVVYAGVVVVLLIAQVVCVALIYTRGDSAHEDVAKGLRTSLKNYYENSTNDVSTSYSAIFELLHCCAVENYTTDFTTDQPNIPFYKAEARSETKYPLIIPITCCRGVDYKGTLDEDLFDKHSECLLQPSKDTAYTEGCLTKIEDAIDRNKQVLIGVGATIIAIEVFMVILSIILCRSQD